MSGRTGWRPSSSGARAHSAQVTWYEIRIHAYAPTLGLMGAREPMRADELAAQLAIDKGYQRRKREVDAELAALAAERERRLEPFTKDLAAAGINATYDPRTGVRNGDHQILDIALRHLGRDGYDDWTRAEIARHLEVKTAGDRWKHLVTHYRQATGELEREALAAALAASARSSNVDELMELVEDSSFAESRILLLRPINRLRGGDGKAFVARLADDPALGKEATAIMRGRSRNG